MYKQHILPTSNMLFFKKEMYFYKVCCKKKAEIQIVDKCLLHVQVSKMLLRKKHVWVIFYRTYVFNDGRNYIENIPRPRHIIFKVLRYNSSTTITSDIIIN